METNDSKSRSWLGLAGHVCVVTGGGSGIGAEVAFELARQGAYVAVLDCDVAAAAQVAGEIDRAGGRSLAIVADISDEDAVTEASNKIQRSLGNCRVLVNNAALVGHGEGLLQTDLAQWNRMLEVNLTGALICARAFYEQMIDSGGGSIVNVASICGHLPLPSGGAYSVAKSGLMMLTRMLALELAEHGIRCNSVSPGLVRTPATERAYSDAVSGEARRRMVPTGRIATPADLANVIAFLASDRSAYVSGEDVMVDGALSQSLLGFVARTASKANTASGISDENGS